MRARESGKIFLVLILCFSGALVLTSCAGKEVREGKAGNEGEKIFVSILPQAYFAERIAGNTVEVGVLVGPGQSPHSFEPAPRQVAALSGARIYFTTGIPFENTLVGKIRASNARLRIVDTTEGLELLPSEKENSQHGHSGPGGEHHDEGEWDPHVWMSPRNAIHQAGVMTSALKEMYPAHAAEYGKNFDALKRDLEQLDEKLTGLLSGYGGRNFFVFHPAFGYFGRAYNLHQVSVETEGKEPGPRSLGLLIDRAKKEHVKIIFVQPQFSSKSAETVAAAIGGIVVRIDPLEKDYINNMEKIAGELKKSFDTGSGR